MQVNTVLTAASLLCKTDYSKHWYILTSLSKFDIRCFNNIWAENTKLCKDVKVLAKFLPFPPIKIMAAYMSCKHASCGTDEKYDRIRDRDSNDSDFNNCNSDDCATYRCKLMKVKLGKIRFSCKMLQDACDALQN